MAYLIEHYPTALKVLTFLLALVNLAAWGELDALWAAAEQQCAARPSTRSQAVLQGLLRPMILFTAVLPLFCCSFIQLGTFYELWSGNSLNAVLLALTPLLAILLHLLTLAVNWLLLGLAE